MLKASEGNEQALQCSSKRERDLGECIPHRAFLNFNQIY